MVPRQLLIGLPGTGKSTFLAALWHVVTSKEVPGALSWLTVKSDTTYIEDIHKNWMRGIPLERTDLVDLPHVERVTLELGQKEGSIGELVVPDLSGEYFDFQWTDRQWSKEYHEMLLSTTSFLLFVSPRNLNTSELISPEIQAMVAVLDNVEEKEVGLGLPNSSSDSTPVAKDFEPKECRTQVKLVELLQFIASRDDLDHLRRFALIVSAWDLLDMGEGSPDIWLKKRLPFLVTYLKNNGRRFEYKTFGISAQGGEDMVTKDGKPTQAASFLLNKQRASERIMVKEGTKAVHHDITQPIKWLAGLTG